MFGTDKKKRWIWGAVGAALGSCAATLLGFVIAWAEPANQTPFQSKLTNACFNCHALDPSTIALPRHPPPKIAGQHAGYLRRALREYRDGQRNHFIMSNQTKDMTDQEITSLAGYLESLDGTGLPTYAPPRFTSASITRGAALAEKHCVTCHSPDGGTNESKAPNLNGQYPRYIMAALMDYRQGVRQHERMRDILFHLSEREDADLIAYYSNLDGLRP